MPSESAGVPAYHGLSGTTSSQNEPSLVGKVVTIRGVVEPSALGITLTHEHVVCDVTFALEPSHLADLASHAEEPVSPANVWWIRQQPESNVDNLRLDDVQTAIKELKHYAADGGGAIVELTVRGLSPDPVGLRIISEATGIHIVSGTGFYTARTRPRSFDSASAREIGRRLAADILFGIDGSTVRAGIIGELGLEGKHMRSAAGAGMGIKNVEDFDRGDVKLLEAAAIAQRMSGASISVHLPHSVGGGSGPDALALGVLRMLADFGANLARVVIGHLDRSEQLSVEGLLDLAATGAYLEFDEWGVTGYVDSSDHTNPSDEQRIRWTEALVSAGRADQLLFSSDVFTKHRWRTFGGPGYSHILRFVLHRLKRRGVSDAVVDSIIRLNPQRMLALVEPVDPMR